MYGFKSNSPEPASYFEAGKRIVNMSHAQLKKNLEVVNQKITEHEARLEDLHKAKRLYEQTLNGLQGDAISQALEKSSNP